MVSGLCVSTQSLLDNHLCLAPQFVVLPIFFLLGLRVSSKFSYFSFIYSWLWSSFEVMSDVLGILSKWTIYNGEELSVSGYLGCQHLKSQIVRSPWKQQKEASLLPIFSCYKNQGSLNSGILRILTIFSTPLRYFSAFMENSRSLRNIAASIISPLAYRFWW